MTPLKTSQSTFQRILSSAYRKVSRALIEGKAIKIEKEKVDKWAGRVRTGNVIKLI